MPTYEYHCLICGFSREEIHNFSEERQYLCELCEDERPLVRKIEGGLGLHFTGTGFYETDYKGK
jgi:putative FmdB family regulatory protein